MIKLKDLLNEKIIGSKVICNSCNWKWYMSDGGNQPYLCHKCGNDNTPIKEAQKAGDINAFGASKVLGKGKKVLGFVPDTPNAIATLIQDFPQAMEIEFKQGFFYDGKLLKSIKKGSKVWKELEKRYLDTTTKNTMKAGFKMNEDNARIPREKGQHKNSTSHSDLFTDENPKGTIHGLKFATVEDAERSVSKIKSSGKPHAHKIQAAIAMEQRAKSAGKSTAAGVYRTYINSIKKS